MRRSMAVTVFLIISLTRSGVSQQRVPVASLAAGLGNAFGWAGLRGEVFVAQGRMSVLAGTGIVPFGGTCCNRLPVPVAASLRYYAGRQEHRVYVDASWSVLGFWSADAYSDDPYWGHLSGFLYGPGLSLGYSFMSRTGLTLTVGAGLGRESESFIPMAQLGVGWTWWRHPPS